MEMKAETNFSVALSLELKASVRWLMFSESSRMCLDKSKMSVKT